MVSDSISSASIVSSNPRDFSKKKRANRSAKLKQCKLDARREQWLSHVKAKGESKGEANGGGTADKRRSQPIGKLEIKTRNEDEIYGDGSSINHYSDSESVQSTSPTSHTSSVSGSNDSGANFTASISGSSTNGSFSGNMSEEEDEEEVDDDCLDDWETLADALAATDEKQKEHSTNTEFDSPPLKDHSTESGSKVDVTDQIFSQICNSSDNRDSGRISNQRGLVNCCAWRPDDACRPQSLPNLTKQYSFPLKSERRLERGSVWGCKNAGLNPTTCPICFEDLDNTDSSFLPCSCGFRLCLFCHKRILEEDARCPGCRKQYEVEAIDGEATIDGGSLTYRLARSCSMVTRS